jgi:hypothetical protein
MVGYVSKLCDGIYVVRVYNDRGQNIELTENELKDCFRQMNILGLVK